MANALQTIDTSTDIETWFTRAHKAAIVLASLSAEAAAEIVQDIDDDQLRIFAKAFCELKAVPPQLLDKVAQEFLAEVNHTDDELAGGVEEAHRVLALMTEQERAERIMSDLDGGGGGAVWPRVDLLEDATLAKYVQAQRLPVAAAIVSKISREKTAGVLALAETEFSQKILLELARKNPPSEAALDEIANVLEEDLLKPKTAAAAPEAEDGGPPPVDPVAAGVVGEIVNFLPGVKRDAFLDHLKDADPDVGAEVRKSVLTFEELYTRMPPAGASALLRDIDREVLLVAIKHGEKNANETVEFLFGNISKRMVEQYREELAEMDEPSEVDGENAQREITAAVRNLVADGEFKLIAIEVEEPEGGKDETPAAEEEGGKE